MSKVEERLNKKLRLLVHIGKLMAMELEEIAESTNAPADALCRKTPENFHKALLTLRDE